MVIIVDAVFNSKRIGEVSVIPLKELCEQKSLDISPHNIHLFNVLYQQQEIVKGYLLAIEPSTIQFHIGLSNELKEQWEQIQTEVKNEIKELMTEQKEW